LQLAAIAVLMGVRYVPAAALGGFFMAFVPDILTRYGHGTFAGRYTYDISFDWFSLALGVLLIAQLILLPDGVWGDIHRRSARMWSAVRTRTAKRVSLA
jgi:ABC-type branched-subunit amino acid transport system permease subunit